MLPSHGGYRVEEVEATTHRGFVDLAKRQDPFAVRTAKEELATAEEQVKATDREIEGLEQRLADAKGVACSHELTPDVVAHDALQKALAKREVAKRLGGAGSY